MTIYFCVLQSVGESWLNSMPNQQPPINIGPITAKPTENTKDWRQSITTELRNHLVQKL